MAETMLLSDPEPAVQALKRFIFWGNIVTLVLGLAIIVLQTQLG